MFSSLYRALPRRFIVHLTLVALSLVLASCSAKFLKVEDEGEIADLEEYDQVVKVKDIEEPKKAAPSQKTKERAEQKEEKAEPKEKAVYKQPPSPKEAPKPKAATKKKAKKRLPEIEDPTGFDGRRPIVDPFRVGEKVVLAVKYFNITAGTMTVETLPFKEVNGKKSYHFKISVKSADSFNWIYSVEDVAETYMDFEEMTPHNFEIHVKESKQLKEVRSHFDWETLTGHYWHNQIKKGKKPKTKKYKWDIKPYSQNAFSAPFYFRTFHLEPGKKIRFPMAHEKKNMTVDAEVLRREKIDTKIGELNTLVVQPQVKIGGLFKPMGDILFWITDDDRKFIVKLESKIKIGTLVGEVIELDPGN